MWVGGSFEDAGGLLGNDHLACWDAWTNTWLPLATPLGDNIVQKLHYVPALDELFVVGKPFVLCARLFAWTSRLIASDCDWYILLPDPPPLRLASPSPLSPFSPFSPWQDRLTACRGPRVRRPSTLHRTPSPPASGRHAMSIPTTQVRTLSFCPFVPLSVAVEIRFVAPFACQRPSSFTNHPPAPLWHNFVLLFCAKPPASHTRVQGRSS